MSRGRLLYDADCAFCTRSAGWLRRLPLHVDVLPMQSLDLAAHGIDPGRAERELPFLPETGPPAYGHRAFAGALATGPWWCRLLTAPVLSPVAAGVYRLVARNRHRLPGGSDACALPDRDDSD